MVADYLFVGDFNVYVAAFWDVLINLILHPRHNHIISGLTLLIAPSTVSRDRISINEIVESPTILTLELIHFVQWVFLFRK